MADDIVYSASLDDDDVLKALQRIDAKLGDIADQGKKSFDTIDKQSGISATKLGVVSGAVGEITSRLIDLGAQAARAFLEIGEAGIALNANLERTGQVFTNVFNDPELGQATVNFLGELSKELRIGRDEAASFAQTILPKSGGLEQFSELLRLTAIQSRTTGQSIGDLEFSIREALSGDFVSLRDRFDLSRAQIDRIKELSSEVGQAQALATVLNEEFESLGKTNITGTLTDSIAVITNRFTDLNQILFESPFEELREAAIRFLDVLDAAGPDLQVAAEAISDLLGDVTEIISQGAIDLFEGIDFQQVADIADQFSNLVASAELFSNIVSDTDFAQGFLDSVEALLNSLDRAVVAAAQLATITKAQRARDVAEAQFLVGGEQAPGVVRGIAQALPGFSSFIGGAAVSPKRRAEAEAAGQAAFEETLRSLLGNYDEYNQKLEENEERQKQRGQAVDEAAQSDREAAIDAQLQARALEEQAQAAESAQEEIADKRAKLEADLQDRLLKIQIRGERRRLDDQIKNAQRREDIARQNAQKIEDIRRNNSQRISDLQEDLADDEAQLAQEQADERADIERDSARRREDIEREFRRELQRIQEDFLQSAQEAERTNDAQAFLRAQRQRDRAIDTAQASREEDLADSERQRKEEVEDVRRTQAQELEAIQEKNRKALEDLQVRLERELEAQAIANQRALEAQTINEQRQAQQRERAQQRELDDFRRLEAQKREALRESLADQLELVNQFNAAQVSAAQQTAETISRILSMIPAGPQPAPSFDTYLPLAGQNRAMMSPPVSGSGGASVSNSRTTNNSPTINVSESLFNDPVQVARLQNIILDTMAGAP